MLVVAPGPGPGRMRMEETVIETDRDEEREQRNGVQVLARAATILRLLAADSSGGLTFSELVARSGLPRTTVHRIRGALEHEDFISTDDATGRLHLGPGIMRLAMSKRDLPTVVKPYLEQLSRELNETVDLGVLDGMHVLFIAQHPAPQRSLMVVSQVGARFPAFCTANGKALLAQLPPDEMKQRLPKRLEIPAQAHAGQSQGPARRAGGGPRDRPRVRPRGAPRRHLRRRRRDHRHRRQLGVHLRAHAGGALPRRPGHRRRRAAARARRGPGRSPQRLTRGDAGRRRS